MIQEAQVDSSPVFAIEKIYIKDASLEIPNAPQVFLERDTPEISVQLNNASEAIENGVFHTTLSVTVTATLKDKTMFLVEVVEAGIFRLMNIPAADMSFVLEVTCPNILFPYAREAISNLVTRAGFPPVMLSPVNFEVLHQQRQQQAEAQAAPAPAVSH